MEIEIKENALEYLKNIAKNKDIEFKKYIEDIVYRQYLKLYLKDGKKNYKNFNFFTNIFFHNKLKKISKDKCVPMYYFFERAIALFLKIKTKEITVEKTEIYEQYDNELYSEQNTKIIQLYITPNLYNCLIFYCKQNKILIKTAVKQALNIYFLTIEGKLRVCTNKKDLTKNEEKTV